VNTRRTKIKKTDETVRVQSSSHQYSASA